MMKLLMLVLLLGNAALDARDDWPQWQGPNRNRISNETGLLKEWPAAGPAVVWTANGVGSGYGSMAVAGSRVYLQARVVPRASSSRSIARTARKCGQRRSVLLKQRCSPSRERDRAAHRRSTVIALYVLTENGDLACLKTDGTMVWQRNILRDFGAPQLRWLISESPLVDGPSLVVSPGGPEAAIVKLDKMTGQTMWTSKELSDAAGLLINHRCRRPGRSHLHEAHGSGRSRRARLRRQADVPLSEGGEQRCERRDASVLK